MQQIKVIFLLVVLSPVILCSNCDQDKTKKIVLGIVPTGNLTEMEINTIKNSIEEYYRFNVKIMDREYLPVEDPEFMKDTLESSYVWYHFHKIRKAHEELTFLCGITDRPFTFNEKHLKRITVTRGLGVDRTMIISTFRIRKESNSETRYKEYLSKVALHETGHLLGLNHCTKSCKCFMIGLNYCKTCDDCVRITDPDDVSKFYAADNKLCPSCQIYVDQVIPEILNKINYSFGYF